MPNPKLLLRAALASLTLCTLLAVGPGPARADNAAENNSPAAAPGDPAAPPKSGEEAFLDLVSAYQSGYLQVVAVSCYQLYAGAGLVEGAFRAGHIDGPTALDILGQNSLLHSVCYTTLVDIQALTPMEDRVAQTEINRLGLLLETENQLLIALSDFFAQPTEANGQKVDAARAGVEQTLDQYAGTDAAPVGS